MKAQPLRKFAREQTHLRLKGVSDAVRKAAKHPQAPETAHDLRVAIRRFTQCVQMFEGLFTPHSVEKVRKPLHKLMSLSGDKRDYDVGIEVLEDSGVKPQSSVMLKFREKRDHELEALARHLDRKKLRHDADRWRQQLHTAEEPTGDWNWSGGVRENVRRMLPPRVGKFFDNGDAAVDARGDHKALHQFRLHTKELRYALEVFLPMYGAALKPKLLALGKLQDRLGAINDCVVVLALPELDRAAARAVNRLLKRREVTLRRYWQDAFPLKKRREWLRALMRNWNN